MKKLRIEDLSVDSYVTDAVTPARGTVEANEATTLCMTAGPACQPTLDASCASSKFCC